MKRIDHFLDADQLRTDTFVRHVEFYDTLDSTNNRAAALACEANIDLPALVLARHQTAGRGRGKNTWWSVDGALTFSVLLEPTSLGISTANWPQLSLATSVAICDALSDALPDVNQRAGASSPPPPVSALEIEPARFDSQSRLGIKWPNDVMLEGRKISGILIESPGGAVPTKDRVIIGIGVNVNNACRQAPVQAIATAMCDISGRQHDRQLVLIAILSAMQARFAQLASGDPQLPADWRRLSLLTGKSVCVDQGHVTMRGDCVEIADDAALVIQTATGRQLAYSGTLRPATEP